MAFFDFFNPIQAAQRFAIQVSKNVLPSVFGSVPGALGPSGRISERTGFETSGPFFISKQLAHLGVFRPVEVTDPAGNVITVDIDEPFQRGAVIDAVQRTIIDNPLFADVVGSLFDLARRAAEGEQPDFPISGPTRAPLGDRPIRSEQPTQETVDMSFLGEAINSIGNTILSQLARPVNANPYNPFGGLQPTYYAGAIPTIARGGAAVIGKVLRHPAVQGAIGGAAATLGVGGNGNGSTNGIGCAGSSRLSQILAVARANSPGATRRNIIAAARNCSIEMAAATYGVSETDVCYVISKGVPRRGRGISSADMRRTRSTIGKVTRMYKSLPTRSSYSRARK